MATPITGATATTSKSQLFVQQLAQSNPTLFNWGFGHNLDDLAQRINSNPNYQYGASLMRDNSINMNPFLYSIDGMAGLMAQVPAQPPIPTIPPTATASSSSSSTMTNLLMQLMNMLTPLLNSTAAK